MALNDWLAGHLAFTPEQRRVLWVLIGLGIGYAGYRYARDRVWIETPQPELGLRQAELADQIDPNDADWSTLAILPGIGEKRARDIIEVREQRRQRNPGQRPFERAEDLYAVKGIGGTTLDKLRPYLTFRASRQPTTDAAGR